MLIKDYHGNNECNGASDWLLEACTDENFYDVNSCKQ